MFRNVDPVPSFFLKYDVTVYAVEVNIFRLPLQLTSEATYYLENYYRGDLLNLSLEITLTLCCRQILIADSQISDSSFLV